jgi:hypothetical protein
MRERTDMVGKRRDIFLLAGGKSVVQPAQGRAADAQAQENTEFIKLICIQRLSSADRPSGGGRWAEITPSRIRISLQAFGRTGDLDRKSPQYFRPSRA